MVNAGQVALKIAGRDAGKLAVVVEVVDNNYVLIDGETRRRKCNVKHLEFLGKEVKVSKDMNSKEIVKNLVQLGFKVSEEKKGNKKEKKEKPKKLRKVKQKEVVSDKKSKKK